MPSRPATAAMVRKRLRRCASRRDAKILQWFFKTGPGEYGEGDVFIGVRVPTLRRIAREFRGVPVSEILRVLRSRIHEERLLALLLLVDAFERGDDPTRKRLYDLYLRNVRFINNWDLVDLTAPNVVGAWLNGRTRAPLDRLARSHNLWERRIAIVATHHFIRNGQFKDTFRIAKVLLNDRHDLIHKATGWMLRETGKRSVPDLERFLRKYAHKMPRTMLRYAIERFPEPKRLSYLRQKERNQ